MAARDITPSGASEAKSKKTSTNPRAPRPGNQADNPRSPRLELALAVALDEHRGVHTPSAKPLSVDAARKFAEEIRAHPHAEDPEGFIALVRRAFEGNAHGVLGFETWAALVESLNLDASDPDIPMPPVHPAAELFPLITEGAFAELVQDIREHGQREPITVTSDGAILDGRNRWRACEHIGIKPITRVFDGDDPVAFVVSANLRRRHLTGDQKAKCIASLLKLDPSRSDRSVAKVAGVDHKTVTKTRSNMESGGEIPHLGKRKGADGKMQLAKKKCAPSKQPTSTPATPSTEAQEPSKAHRRPVSLNAATKAMRKAVMVRSQTDPKAALEVVREAARLGLYQPGNDAMMAFTDLLAWIGTLLERVP